MENIQWYQSSAAYHIRDDTTYRPLTRRPVRPAFSPSAAREGFHSVDP